MCCRDVQSICDRLVLLVPRPGPTGRARSPSSPAAADRDLRLAGQRPAGRLAVARSPAAECLPAGRRRTTGRAWCAATADRGARGRLGGSCPRAGVAVRSLEPERRPLEEVFLAALAAAEPTRGGSPCPCMMSAIRPGTGRPQPRAAAAGVIAAHRHPPGLEEPLAAAGDALRLEPGLMFAGGFFAFEQALDEGGDRRAAAQSMARRLDGFGMVGTPGGRRRSAAGLDDPEAARRHGLVAAAAGLHAGAAGGAAGGGRGAGGAAADRR